jgi:glyceraldehyde-3-phosphate dehydrogenase (NADP+)
MTVLIHGRTSSSSRPGSFVSAWGRRILFFVALQLLLLPALVLLLASNAASNGSSNHAGSDEDAAAARQECYAAAANNSKPPFVTAPEVWLPESIAASDLPTKDVISYMDTATTTTTTASTDGISSSSSGTCTASAVSTAYYKGVAIGAMPQFRTQDALHVLEAASEAWRGGSGPWTAGHTLQQRIAAIRSVFADLDRIREDIVTALMWEIGKNRVDAEGEYDRTKAFFEQVAAAMTQAGSDDEYAGRTWQRVGGVSALVKRNAIGVILALAPYNYPMNESYATIIPALLLGNVVILKIPTTGGLVHLLTIDAFRKHLPPNAISFIAGSGRATMPPLMETGKIDGLAFIGGSKAADELIHAHPHPHRLKVFLQLEAKNMAIVLDDVFTTKTDKRAATKLFENTVDQILLGSLSFNGQRCTALKLILAPASHAPALVRAIVQKVEAMRVGLPWQRHGDAAEYSQITPLPNLDRIKYMQELLSDAVAKGATIQNENGGQLLGGGGGGDGESTLMIPAVVYPVTPDMKLYHEEQFGPIVPVAEYRDLRTVLDAGTDGAYAQQVSVFGTDAGAAAQIVDRFAAVFGKINFNVQAGRSPDTLPFSGRRSSAMGVMSVTDILREFSVPTVLAHKDEAMNGAMMQSLMESSVFLGAGQSIKPE